MSAIPPDVALMLLSLSIAGDPSDREEWVVILSWDGPMNGPPRRTFVRSGEPAKVVTDVRRLRRRGDVRILASPVSHRDVKRPDRQWVVAVELKELDPAFAPAPAFQIRADGRLTCVWALARAASPHSRIGERLAKRLGGKAVDTIPAPGSLEFKVAPPRRVRCLSAMADGPPVSPADLLTTAPQGPTTNDKTAPRRISSYGAGPKQVKEPACRA